ncbi:hypothetical protein [Caballeronia grimmiae]|uniref:hypothetical protein n=1 Tax=Caballeronia grimmiae TaxID=1071679 RepID=UPI0038B9D2A8
MTMITLEEAADLIAITVFERQEQAAPALPSSESENYRESTLKRIKDAYVNAIVRAFERGEIRLHSASSFLPLPPAAGVGVAILGGRVQVPEVNRWLATLDVPVSIEQPVCASVDESGAASDPARNVLWHRDPYWRQRIFASADHVAEKHVAQGWGGTMPRDVMEQVAVLMRQERGFPSVSAQSIRKYVLNSHDGLPGWTIAFRSRNAKHPNPLPDVNSLSLHGAMERSGADDGADGAGTT